MIQDSWRVGAVVVLLAAVVAGVVAAGGLTPEAHRFYDLRLPPDPMPMADAVAIALDNLRLALLPVGAALIVRRMPWARAVADLVLLAVLALNATLAGAAIGAYGLPLLAALALHGPLEVAAFALAGASYVRARRGDAALAVIAAPAAIGGLLLLVAAALETRGGI